MNPLIEDQDVYVIWGEAPDTDWNDGEEGQEPKFGEQVVRPVEVEFAASAADAYVMRGVHAAFTSFLGSLKQGGTMSVMITRGRKPEEGREQQYTTGSFVINNPDGKRHVWEYRVQKRKAVV